MRLFKRGKIWWVTYGSAPQKRVSTGQTNRQNRSLTYVILRVDKRFRICVQISCNILVCHVE